MAFCVFNIYYAVMCKAISLLSPWRSYSFWGQASEWNPRLPSNCAMALKRARLEDSYQDPFHDSLQDSDVQDDVNASASDAAQQLRKMVTALWASGFLDAATIVTLCYYITNAGAAGVSDFSLHPSNATKHGGTHLKLVLGRTYERPVQHDVETPIYDKIMCARTSTQIPMRLPTQCLAEECSDVLSKPEPSGEDTCVHAGIEKYKSHPVVQRAMRDNVHWSRVIPVAIYFDGVQYSKRDSFMVLQTRNLRTNESHLTCVIRPWACLAP